jgi:hypothetical protein
MQTYQAKADLVSSLPYRFATYILPGDPGSHGPLMLIVGVCMSMIYGIMWATVAALSIVLIALCTIVLMDVTDATFSLLSSLPYIAVVTIAWGALLCLFRTA